mgnify:CR=1 FL=1
MLYVLMKKLTELLVLTFVFRVPRLNLLLLEQKKIFVLLTDQK